MLCTLALDGWFTTFVNYVCNKFIKLDIGVTLFQDYFHYTFGQLRSL